MYCPNIECFDAKRTGIPGQYNHEIMVCPKCDHDLVVSKPEWAQAKEVDSKDLFPEYTDFVLACELGDVSLIPLVKSLLQSANIRFFIKNEQTQHLFGSGTAGLGYNLVSGPPLVMVDPAGAEEAIELLSEINKSRTDA
jgi:hypothetical protein